MRLFSYLLALLCVLVFVESSQAFVLGGLFRPRQQVVIQNNIGVGGGFSQNVFAGGGRGFGLGFNRNSVNIQNNVGIGGAAFFPAQRGFGYGVQANFYGRASVGYGLGVQRSFGYGYAQPAAFFAAPAYGGCGAALQFAAPVYGVPLAVPAYGGCGGALGLRFY